MTIKEQSSLHISFFLISSRICAEEEEDLPLEQRLQPTEHLRSTLSAVTIKKEYDIDE